MTAEFQYINKVPFPDRKNNNSRDKTSQSTLYKITNEEIKKPKKIYIQSNQSNVSFVKFTDFKFLIHEFDE